MPCGELLHPGQSSADDLRCRAVQQRNGVVIVHIVSCWYIWCEHGTDNVSMLWAVPCWHVQQCDGQHVVYVVCSWAVRLNFGAVVVVVYGHVLAGNI